jgi:hypothetical protein
VRKLTRDQLLITARSGDFCGGAVQGFLCVSNNFLRQDQARDGIDWHALRRQGLKGLLRHDKIGRKQGQKVGDQTHYITCVKQNCSSNTWSINIFNVFIFFFAARIFLLWISIPMCKIDTLKSRDTATILFNSQGEYYLPAFILSEKSV